MDGPTWRVGCCCLFLLVLAAFARSEGVQSCEEVRKLFQWRLVGAVKGLPDTPRPGPDLQVCVSKKPTCCTRKMEERYQIAARQDMQQALQTSSSTLKFLISRNAAAFQGDIESLASINKAAKQSIASKEKKLKQAVQNFIYTPGTGRNLFMTATSLLSG